MNKKDENPINMQTGAPCTDEEVNYLVNIQLAIDTRPWLDGVEIYLRGENHNLSPLRGELYQAVGLCIVKVEETASLISKPAFSLRDKEVQQLMTGLWRMGYRPNSEMIPTAHTLDAVNKHLEDMRTLVFDKWLVGKGEP